MVSRNVVLGLLTGLVLGVAAAFGGFTALVIVTVLGAAGLLVGRYLDGDLDFPEWTDQSRAQTGRR